MCLMGLIAWQHLSAVAVAENISPLVKHMCDLQQQQHLRRTNNHTSIGREPPPSASTKSRRAAAMSQKSVECRSRAVAFSSYMMACTSRAAPPHRCSRSISSQNRRQSLPLIEGRYAFPLCARIWPWRRRAGS